jgi:hypothetical protein
MLLRPSVFRVPVPCCFLACLLASESETIFDDNYHVHDNDDDDTNRNV